MSGNPTNSNWFEDTSNTANDPIIVDRPVGVNTINSSLGPKTHDLKGQIPIPKFLVSPWCNSTYEPDGAFLCGTQKIENKKE